MILHIIEQHSAGLYYVGKFEEMFPQRNITIFIKGRNNVEIFRNGDVTPFSSIKKAVSHLNFDEIKIVLAEFVSFRKEYIILKYIPKSKPIVWWMFGGDLYDHFLYYKGYKLYALQTADYRHRHWKQQNIWKQIAFRFFKPLQKNIIDYLFLKRVIGVISCVPPDYYLSCRLFKHPIEFVDIHPHFIILDLPFATGNDIMVGHSASMTCNHLYILDIIRGIDIKQSELHLTLSYNIQRDGYRTEVMEKYSNCFDDHVKFILDYMDKNTYRRSFLNYKVAIFGSWRQEALANIYICFQVGVKVFLSINNPCLDHFRKEGYYVYALEDIKSPEDFNPLTLEQKEHNRSVFIEKKEKRDAIVANNMKDYFLKYV